MVKDLLTKMLDNTERDLKRMKSVATKINALEPEIQLLSNEALRAKTEEFKKRLADGQALDAILPEAFAVCREAGKRYLNMRHFDVQLMGGITLHEGRIAEMKTGEGKTLVATLALYLNALEGKGAHLVTVNDYLARRDAVWMGPLFHGLGVSLGIIQGQSMDSDELGGSYIYEPGYQHADPRYLHLRDATRKEVYHCDITYGTNHEYAFDYLRDNMVYSGEELSQRELNFAIVDEVDSILIDEARTPHIISGQVEEDVSVYYKVDSHVRRLQPERDYTVDEKHHQANLTEEGADRLEQMLGLRNLADDPDMMHYVSASLKAHGLFKKDVNYVVKDGEIIIVDEFTGRMMFGRRYSDGLHQAIEAKENVEIKNESQTIATITFQNYFRMYKKLAGMTGTAKTEEEEFRKIYGLDVMSIPTHRPMIRQDHPDVVYKTLEAKFRGVAMELLRLYTKQQPVLVGTRSIEMSEVVSRRLTFDKLQLLVLVERIRESMEGNKNVPKEKQEEWRKQLLTPIEMLSTRILAPIARELGLNPQPTAQEHIDALLKRWDMTGENAAYLQEALEHGVPHNVLNAKFHEKEALIISEAGRKGAVTIATNMAGRGVDILLGGHVVTASAQAKAEEANEMEATGTEHVAPVQEFRRGGRMRAAPPMPLSDQERSAAADEVRKLGGLLILGTERHESRRIDNQLRGRSGRQGDPGESRFFLSLEDEFVRIFGEGLKTNPFLRGWPEEEPLEHKMLSRAIENAQKRVELHNFAIRKHVLQYDDVLNNQRSFIYRQRRAILEGYDLRNTVVDYLSEVVEEAVETYASKAVPPSEWDIQGLYQQLNQVFPLETIATEEDLRAPRHDLLVEKLNEYAVQAYEQREQEMTPEIMREAERMFMLRTISRKWIEHLASMEYLREGIGLRGYAQVDPLVAYKREAGQVFEETLHSIRDEVLGWLFHFQVAPPPPRQMVRINPGGGNPAMPGGSPVSRSGAVQRMTASSSETAETGTATAQLEGTRGKIGRNDPCPCGSGKKYKKCCYPKYG
jgi:preprotein translocase subunit SecA